MQLGLLDVRAHADYDDVDPACPGQHGLDDGLARGSVLGGNDDGDACGVTSRPRGHQISHVVDSGADVIHAAGVSYAVDLSEYAFLVTERIKVHLEVRDIPGRQDADAGLARTDVERRDGVPDEIEHETKVLRIYATRAIQ